MQTDSKLKAEQSAPISNLRQWHSHHHFGPNFLSSISGTYLKVVWDLFKHATTKKRHLCWSLFTMCGLAGSVQIPTSFSRTAVVFTLLNRWPGKMMAFGFCEVSSNSFEATCTEPWVATHAVNSRPFCTRTSPFIHQIEPVLLFNPL